MSEIKIVPGKHPTKGDVIFCRGAFLPARLHHSGGVTFLDKQKSDKQLSELGFMGLKDDQD